MSSQARGPVGRSDFRDRGGAFQPIAFGRLKISVETGAQPRPLSSWSSRHRVALWTALEAGVELPIPTCSAGRPAQRMIQLSGSRSAFSPSEWPAAAEGPCAGRRSAISREPIHRLSLWGKSEVRWTRKPRRFTPRYTKIRRRVSSSTAFSRAWRPTERC